MNKDLNMWIGIGRLGGPVEFKQLQGGRLVANFSIASNDDYMSNGVLTKRVNWTKVSVFGPRAQAMANFLGKGSRIQVTGKLISGDYTNPQGIKVFFNSVTADDVQFLDTNTGVKPVTVANTANLQQQGAVQENVGEYNVKQSAVADGVAPALLSPEALKGVKPMKFKDDIPF